MPVDLRPERIEPGSASSLKELIRDYFMDVYGACLRVLGRPHGAEDATQEVFLSLFRTQDKLAAAQSVRAWVMTVARNTAISMLRRRHPGPPLSEPMAAAPPIASLGDPERLHQALAGLDEKERDLIQMRFLEDKSAAEMAAATGRTKRAVTVALCRALERLRGLYHEEHA